jgi:rhodanese-related sulfurtransferase
MRRKLLSVGLAGLVLAGGILMAICATAGDTPRMTKEDLKARLGDSDLILLDVRTPASWDKSDKKILGAIRENPDKFEFWADKYPKDKTLVLYCA